MTTAVERTVQVFEDRLQTTLRYWNVVGLDGIRAVMSAKLRKQPCLYSVSRPGIRHPFKLRLPSTDILTYIDVFQSRDYEFEMQRAPKVIVDAGANIGLSAIFFANRFPEARIIALEPDAENFKLLSENIAAYPQITAVQAALWDSNGEVKLVDPGHGQWGFRTSNDELETRGREYGSVRALTLDRLMQDFDLSRIELLKLDVEGAECEILADPSAWIERVDAILIELHDRIRPGCSRTFHRATEGFGIERCRGITMCAAREGSCIAGAHALGA